MQGKTPFLTGTPTGYYKLGVTTGVTTGLGAGAPVFSMRWSSTVGIRAILLYLRVNAQVLTPFTAANEISFAAQMARGFTAFDTGGTLLSAPAAPNQVMNSLGDQSSIADIRVAIAASLGNGTRTLDTNPFLQGIGNQIAAAASIVTPVGCMADWRPAPDMSYPINFRADSPNQEGFIVKNTAAQGAGGTIRYAIEVEWLEYNAQSNIGTLG